MKHAHTLTRRADLVTRFGWALLLGGCSLFAQVAPPSSSSTRAAVGTDLVFHRFRPKVSPEAAAGRRALGGESSALNGISAEAAKQIEALQQEKRNRTAAQLKVDSRLLYTARMLQDKPVAAGVPVLETDVELDGADNLVVELSADVNGGLLERLRESGATVLATNPRLHSIQAILPHAKLETIAGWQDVRFIAPRPEASTSRAWGKTGPALRGDSAAPHSATRTTEVRNQLAAFLEGSTEAAAVSGIWYGSKLSEGDKTHRASAARGAFGVDGTGVKIGVLSDGVTSLATSQARGDLGTVIVLPGQAGSGDEGTAMLEIIRDLAPGATLYFATAFNGITSFADNIRALRAAGCDIIVDDVSYFVETRFQDGQAPGVVSPYNCGVVAQAVKEVVADGAMYFSSAGNSGNQSAGTSGTWEGNFTDGGAAATPLAGAGQVHLFSPGMPFNTITGTGGWIILAWADPLGASTNDYDLYRLNSTGTAVLSASANAQNGTQDPVEAINSSPSGNRIVVVLSSGSPRYFHLTTNRGALAYATSGTSYGHNASASSMCVAAAPAYWPWGPGPTGPWPAAFSASSGLEPFTSDGPRRIFFEGDGTPITPGNFTATGGRLLRKPDFTAADGTSVTGVGGFPSPFYGTSAAAPHAAAIAGLLKSARPDMSGQGILAAMKANAIDIGVPGWDRDSGAGIVMAYETMAYLGVTRYANPDLGTVTVSENPGNGNGTLERGEGGVLTVQLTNLDTVMKAKGVTATLTSTTPGVIITTPGVSTYPDLSAGASATNQVPFRITVGPAFDPCATKATFRLDVAYSGGPAPTKTLWFDAAVGGTSATVITRNLGAATTVVPNIVMATGTQTGRMNRFNIIGACPSKTYPGTFTTSGARVFDSFTFTALSNACVPFTLTNTGPQLYLVLYAGTFDPASLGAGFLSDPGSSASPMRFEATLTAGQSYTLVVHEVNVGGGVNSPYTLTIPGCVHTSGTVNQLPIAIAQDKTVAGAIGGVHVSVDNGSSDPDGDPITLTQWPAAPYGFGVTPVTLIVTDSKGASATATATVTVNKFASTTQMTPSTGAYGSAVLSARVSAAQGIPSGRVAFHAADHLITAGLDEAGHVSVPVPALGVGVHTVYAKYLGGPAHTNSESLPVTVTVTKAATTTTLASAGQSKVGDPVTFTAKVASLGVTPVGTVTFLEGSTSVGTAELQSGSASITLNNLSMGTHSLQAVFSANANFEGSSSAALSHVVAQPTAMSLNPATGAFGAMVLTAKVTSPAGTPTGSVVFKTGAITLGTAALAGGVATLTTNVLPVGVHTIVASFMGGGSYLGCESIPLEVVVGKAATSVALSASPAPSHVGESVVITATVSSPTAIPMGTVVFTEGTKVLATVEANAGKASFTLDTLTQGVHALVASFQGGANYSASTSPILNHTVEQPAVVILPTAPSALTTSAGRTISFQLPVAKAGNVTSAVNFSVAGLPTGARCYFSPATVMAANLPASVTVTITTDGLDHTNFAAILPEHNAWPLLAVFPGFLGFTVISRRNRRGVRTLMALLLMVAAGLMACGGKSSSKANNFTPAGTYDLTITAASTGATPALLKVRLTVNP